MTIKQGEVERGSGSSVEVHVKFLGEEHRCFFLCFLLVTFFWIPCLFVRSWIAASLLKQWDEEVDKSGGAKEKAWLKGMEEAEDAVTLTNDERLALLVIDQEDEDEVLADDEQSQEEEKPPKRRREKSKSPLQKRRRIVRPADSDSDSDSEEER